MGEEEAESLALTPTWVVAAVCLVIVAISLTAERLLHKLGKARLPLPELAAPSLPPELLCSAASTNLFPSVVVTTLIWLSVVGMHISNITLLVICKILFSISKLDVLTCFR